MDFLKNNKRFSFKIGEKDAWDMNYETEVQENRNEIITVYSFENGLKVTNTAKKYDKFGAYEWVNYFENTSDMPTEIISELWDADCTLPIEYEKNREWVAEFPDRETATKIYSPTGSNWSAKEFYCDVNEHVDNTRKNHIEPGNTKEYSASNGRSSEAKAPFFNVHKNGRGYIFAIGWSGQWNSSISRSNDSITFKSKIEDTYFRMMPGETFRTSSVVVMPYEADVIGSQNLWRRLVKEEFSLLGQEGRPQYAPICASIWGGMKSESVLERINLINKNDMAFDYIWMDAGWYGIDTQTTPNEFEGDWWAHTGDWRVSPLIHPQGLRDVSKEIHDSGRKFLLWFEPERVVRTTPIAVEHPEWFLSSNDPHDTNKLMNLANDEAWNYCFNVLSDKIEELSIDCLRIDFNFGPLVYWRNGDNADRRGISEIKYINSFYKLWDALLEKFPHLIIDDCASGGRRIDIETLRRSVPLWRSDFQCPINWDIEGTQCHTQSFNTWMPFSATGAGRTPDEYRVRSAYSAGINMGMFYSESDKLDEIQDRIAFAKKYSEEAVKVRPYFSEDFYPLTETTTRRDVWCANQFDRPSEKDGIVQVFVRENAPYECASFKLRAINPNSDYLFTDADGGEFTVSGKELVENGFRVEIKEKRKAKLYFYKEI